MTSLLPASVEPPVAVLRCAELGRYAVAARPLAAGQILFEETAIAIGPKPHTSVVCLGCSRPVTAVQPAREERCADCGWPLCRPDCEAAHLHRDAECTVFRTARGARFYGVQPAVAAAGDDVVDAGADSVACMQLDCITPLRCVTICRDDDVTH